MGVNAMRAKTGSSLATVMSSIFVMAMKLRNTVWKKPSKITSIAPKANPMSLENAIIDKLCKYIDGVITAKEFSDWFVPTTWEIDPKDQRASKLVYSIKLLFAQYTTDKWTKAELRERLIDLIL